MSTETKSTAGLAEKSEDKGGETIALKQAVTFDGKEVREVIFRENLTAADLMDAEDELIMSGVARGIMLPPGQTNMTRYSAHIIARAIGKPVEFVERLGIADYRKLSQKAQRFLA